MMISTGSMRFITAFAFLALAAASDADELLYIYSPDCGACMKWKAEVEPVYGKTQEAITLPLTKITLEDWASGKHPLSNCQVAAVLGTPTFVQFHDCREVDRITGYSSDELFWFALARMTNRAQALD